MDDKKKLIVLAVLAVVILAVGAFQFVGAGGEPPKPKEEPKKEAAEARRPSEPSLPNPQFANPLPPRDPFDPTTAVASLQRQTPQEPEPKPAPEPKPLTGKLEPLPPVMPSGLSGSLRLSPDKPAEPPAPKFVVTGVFLGEKSAAVIQDEQGNQKLVGQGEALDGDTRVVAVDRNRVVLRQRGKTVVLTVGGEAQ
ncbi:MAG: hypothetical protein N2109_04230 [Fimbriimonadales bacterium]|nr:hypothetical protein [Fimbriimonadales bacterium]